MDSDIVISERIQGILSFLNEKQQRIHLESEAAGIGWGGVSKNGVVKVAASYPGN